MNRLFYINFEKLTNEQKNYILTMLKDFNEPLDTSYMADNFNMLWYNTVLKKWCFVPNLISGIRRKEVEFDGFVYELKQQLIYKHLRTKVGVDKEIEGILNY